MELTLIKVSHDDGKTVYIPVVPKDDCAGVHTLTLNFLKSCFEDAPITALKTDDKAEDPKYLLMRQPGNVIEIYDTSPLFKTVFK